MPKRYFESKQEREYIKNKELVELKLKSWYVGGDRSVNPDNLPKNPPQAYLPGVFRESQKSSDPMVSIQMHL